MVFCGLLRGLRKCLQKVRRMEEIRLVGHKKNPHNRQKKNWLCGFVVYANIKNYYWIIQNVGDIFALLPLVDTVDIEFDTLEKDESVAWNYYLIPLMYK